MIDFVLVILFGQIDLTLNRIRKGGGEQMTQEELRELYNERLEKEKQTYISKVTGIDGAILSKFKNNKINLYPALFAKLGNYLLNS